VRRPNSSTRRRKTGEAGAVGALRLGAPSPFLLACDHAGRAVPARLRGLGLPPDAFERHIAWDIGALGVARRLSEVLDAPLLFQRWSRLVIDCNRHPDAADAILAVSDGQAIPANGRLTAAERARRIADIHAPYHLAIAAELDARAARGLATLVVAVHSFTPTMNGQARLWRVGVLHGGASPASSALIALLRREETAPVGDNEPYAMDGTDFTVPHHAWRRGLDAVELEIRQDLIADEDGQAAIAALFARLLPRALAAS